MATKGKKQNAGEKSKKTKKAEKAEKASVKIEKEEKAEKPEKKTKKHKKVEEHEESPVSPPQSPVAKKGRKAQQKLESKFNKLFYPENADLQFPDQLQDSIFKVIASFNNNATHHELIKNLGLFYEKVEEAQVNSYLESAEDNGTIFERHGKYSVTEEFLPQPPTPPAPQAPPVAKAEEEKSEHEEKSEAHEEKSEAHEVKLQGDLGEQINFEEDLHIQPASEKKEGNALQIMQVQPEPEQEDEELFQ